MPAGSRYRWVVCAALAATVAVVAGGPAAAAHLQTTTTEAACVRTTPNPSKPTGVSYILNATREQGNGWGDAGVFLKWNAWPWTEHVYSVRVYKGELQEGTSAEDTVLTNYVGHTNAKTWNVQTQSWTYPGGSPTSLQYSAFNPFGAPFLADGTTYVFRVVGIRDDNCEEEQLGVFSDPLTVTYTAPAEDDSEDDLIGGL